MHNVVITPDTGITAVYATASKSDPFTSCGAFDATRARWEAVVTTFTAAGDAFADHAFWIAIN